MTLLGSSSSSSNSPHLDSRRMNMNSMTTTTTTTTNPYSPPVMPNHNPILPGNNNAYTAPGNTTVPSPYAPTTSPYSPPPAKRSKTSTGTAAASASAANSSATSSTSSTSSTSQDLFWQWDIDQVDKWVRTVTTLFPRPKSETTTDPSSSSSKEHHHHLSESEYWKRTSTSTGYLQHLLTAIRSAAIQHDTAANRDLYKILDSSFSRGKDIVHKPGAILSRLTIGGILNGISGKIGGVTEPDARPKAVTADGGISEDMKKWARNLKQATNAKLEIDMMESTPLRIVEIMCPEVSLVEVNAIRKRIYDTVVLGRGTNSSNVANALETEDLPVAAKVSLHDIDKWKKCKVCNNNNQSEFLLDRKNGDLICTQCGTIASSSLMHEGSQFRKFEGEADRNHHGDVANPLYSNAHNMGTTLGGTSFQSNNALGGKSRQTLETVLRNAHAYTEMNISQFGKEEKKTRVGYKDRQKKDAFVKMTHVGDALNLHEAVVQRAKELFAGFRDDRELVQQFKGVVAACLCEAYHQLSSDGRQILKKVCGEEEEEEDKQEGGRANWRNDMHRSTAASVPGFLDQKEATTEEPQPDKKEDKKDGVESKPAPLWMLDDCRSWLLDSSRSIARLWHDSSTTHRSKSLSELEGKLVEHTLVLCDYLESQLNSTHKSYHAKQRVITPRVDDMAKLKISWQHVDMQRPQGAKERVKTLRGKTAGQLMIMLTTKKWGDIIKDKEAGDAFHKELRAVLAVQESWKKKRRSEEMAQQRFKQMKRKPWLSARAKI